MNRYANCELSPWNWASRLAAEPGSKSRRNQTNRRRNGVACSRELANIAFDFTTTGRLSPGHNLD